MKQSEGKFDLFLSKKNEKWNKKGLFFIFGLLRPTPNKPIVVFKFLVMFFFYVEQLYMRKWSVFFTYNLSEVDITLFLYEECYNI